MIKKIISNKSVIIIGGGIGGLATAALLAKKGFSVTLLEKNKQLGGRMSVLKAKGFTFDMGPSWYMMPEVFEKFFAEFDKKPADLFKLKHLDPQHKVFWGNNDFQTIYKNLQKNLRMFESLEPGSSTKITKYLALTKKIYYVAIKNFLYTDFQSILSKLKLFLPLGLPWKLFFINSEQFVSDYVKAERLKQMLTYWAVFLGASPAQLPALYSLMSHVDLLEGIYYPVGGMSEIPNAIVQLARKYGAKLKTSVEVTDILVKNGIATGVRTSKGIYKADIIVANCDYAFTETKLLPQKARSFPHSYWSKMTIAPSMFLMYVGIKGRLRNAAHHNLFLSKDWEKHFDSLFKNPHWPDDPCYYVCVPSITDPSVAPKDCENIFVLVPVAAGLKDTPAIKKQYSTKILRHLEDTLGESINKKIIYKKIFSVHDYEKLYNAYKGTALGLTHTLRQTAFLRPPMKSKKLSNLYFVGQYTMPGTGVPMCLISAQLVAKRLCYEK